MAKSKAAARVRIRPDPRVTSDKAASATPSAPTDKTIIRMPRRSFK